MDIRWTKQSLALLLICAAGCGGTVRVLREDPQLSRLPDTIAVVPDPSILVSGQPGRLTAVGEVRSPHGEVTYTWGLDGIGSRVGAVSAAASATEDEPPQQAAGTDRSIEITVATVAARTTRSGSVTIDITWNGVTESKTQTFTVTIDPAPAQAATIGGILPQAAQVDVPTKFGAAVSAATAVAYLWDFGADATVDDPTSATPTVTFTETGNRSVTLKLFSQAVPTQELASRTTVVEVRDASASPITASIQGLVPATATAGIPTTFSAAVTSSGTIQYLWDFGSDAILTDPTEEHPVVTFRRPGEFNVTLAVYSAEEPLAVLDSVIRAVVVHPAVDVLGITPDTATAGQPTQFSIQVAPPGDYAYVWQFDQNVTITNGGSAAPTVTFPSSGTFTGSLLVNSKQSPGVLLGSCPISITVP